MCRSAMNFMTQTIAHPRIDVNHLNSGPGRGSPFAIIDSKGASPYPASADECRFDFKSGP